MISSGQRLAHSVSIHTTGCLSSGAIALLLVGAWFWLAPADAEAEFGFQEISLIYSEDSGSPAVQAGSHPFAVSATVDLRTAATGSELMPDGELRGLNVYLARGLVSAPLLLPHCRHSQLANDACPHDSAVGTIQLASRLEGEAVPYIVQAPLYNLDPLGGTAAEFGIYLKAGGVELPLTIQFGISPLRPHLLFASLVDAPRILPVFGFQIVLWGNPGDPAHDPYRGKCGNAFAEGETFELLSSGTCPLDNGLETPLLSLPTNCAPGIASFEATAWDRPTRAAATMELPALQGCQVLPFSPSLNAAPTTRHAGLPTPVHRSVAPPNR